MLLIRPKKEILHSIFGMSSLLSFFVAVKLKKVQKIAILQYFTVSKQTSWCLGDLKFRMYVTYSLLFAPEKFHVILTIFVATKLKKVQKIAILQYFTV